MAVRGGFGGHSKKKNNAFFFVFFFLANLNIFCRFGVIEPYITDGKTIDLDFGEECRMKVEIL